MNLQNLSGQKLGQYELRELLGIGGMGAVYRGYQEMLRREVAVKVLNPALVNSPELIERFNREALSYASLEHAHIVPVYDFGTQDGISYVVMRLLTGGTLEERIEHSLETGRPLPSLGETAVILRQLASALDYAHSRGVIHRDIKTSNIMFDDHGTAFIVDFGIAKLMHATSALTGTGMAMGTPSYMAPEQWRGDPVTPAADQYSLAVLAFVMLTTRMPFEADTPFALMNKHLNEEPTPITNFRADLPDSVREVLRKALAKVPTDRYAGVLTFVDAFEAAIQGRTDQPTGFFITPLPQRAVVPPLPESPSVSASSQPPRIEPTMTQSGQRGRGRLVFIVALFVLAIALVGGFIVLSSGGGDNNGDAGATETALALAALATDTPIPTDTATITPVPSDTATDTLTPGATETDSSPTATNTPTRTVTPTPSRTPTATPATPVVQPNRDLVLRAGPGSSYPRIATLEAGTTVTINGISEDGGWYQVILDDGSLAWMVTTNAFVDVYGQVRDVAIAQAPTETPSDTPTASNTPSRTPSHTPTRTPSRTPSATSTPRPPTATDTPAAVTTCAGAPPSRLEIGMVGYVLDDDQRPLNVRSGPGTDNRRIDQLQIRATFTILDGPVCADGFAWYRVQYQGIYDGWVAEGDETSYYIGPLDEAAVEAGIESFQGGCDVTVIEDFDSEDTPYDWFEGSNPRSTVQIANGVYEITIADMPPESAAVEPTSWGSLRGYVFDDASVEAIVSSSRFDADVNARTGLWVRYQDEFNFVAIMIRSDGSYRIARFVENRYTDLAGWTFSDAINTGDDAENTIRVDMVGDSFTLYINGQFLETVVDDTWPDGRIAFWGSSEDTPVVFSMDDFRVCGR